MATVTSLGISFTTTAGNKTVTATPAVGDVIVVIAANTALLSPPVVTDNQTPAGAYTVVKTNTKASSADTLWVLIRTTPITAASSTIFTMTQAGDTGGGLQVFKVAGLTRYGINAIRQVAGQSDIAAAATPAPVFVNAILTGNPVIGAVFNASNPATLTPPTGWTESQDVGFTVPTTGLETVFINSGSTLTTVTWGSTSATIFCDAVIELDTTILAPNLLNFANGPPI